MLNHANSTLLLLGSTNRITGSIGVGGMYEAIGDM